MSHLDAQTRLHAEAETLRCERQRLKEEVQRRKWRLHRLPGLQRQLADVTKRLMAIELKLSREKRKRHDAEQRLQWWQRD